MKALLLIAASLCCCFLIVPLLVGFALYARDRPTGDDRPALS